MDELIKRIVAKTGISEDQARMAVQAVADFLKEKLPAPLASQVDAAMSGSTPDLGELGKGLGGIFGR
jgi:hypothetical protein